MTVAVQMPGQRQEEDGLTKIAKGLAVANNILGIKQKFDDSALKQKQMQAADAEAQRKKDGKLTPMERVSLGTQGMEVPQGTEGAVGGLKDQSGNEIFFLPKTAADIAQKNKDTSKESQKLAEKLAKEKREGDLKRASDLRGEYFRQSKNTFEALQGFKKVEAAFEDPAPNGATDMALIFGLMKTLDPGSTVREGEFATAEQTRGLDQTIVGLYNRAREGQRLTPEQRKNFYDSAARQLSGQLQVQDQTDNQFSDLSKRYDVDSDLVVDPRFKLQADKIQESLTKLGGGKNLVGNNAPPQKDQFVVGQEVVKNGNIYRYIGNDQWQDLGTQNARK